MSKISIIEKPLEISWETIHEVLLAAHQENRSKGIIMAYSVQEGDKIKEIIEDSGGIMFVALDENKVVGTLGVEVKKENRWYNKGLCAYYVFGSLLPEYRGMGIFQKLNEQSNSWVKEKGLPMIVSATHEKNKRMIQIWKETGFKKVHFRAGSDHYNVYVARYLRIPAPSNFTAFCMFNISKLFYKLRYRIDKEKGCVKRFGI